jgi:hypothetical protein
MAALALGAITAGGCGDDPSADNASTQTSAAERTTVARAELRGLGPAAGAKIEYAFTGAVVVTAELSRIGRDYTLTVDSQTEEPYIVVLATGSCGGFARTGSVGRELYAMSGLPSDAPEGGEPGERHVIPLDTDLAHELTITTVTVFADSGGAHNPDYIYCGPLERVLLGPLPVLPVPADDAEATAWIRTGLELYERTYLECRYASNPRNAVYTDAAYVYRIRIHRAREAAGIGEAASFVAWTACTNGIAHTPWPIIELGDLEQ